MGIGLFQRSRKAPKIMPASTRRDIVELRVLVDSGPNARDLFVIEVNGDDSVEAIRTTISSHIGHESMSLFKVSIPWQANYEASAYTERYGVSASLLSVFPGFNLDDATQLAASGGVRRPAYINGTGSVRSRRTARWSSSGFVPTVRDWFPAGGDCEAINVLVRTASISSLDWARPPVTPVTLAGRFTSSSSDYPTEEVILVDIAPTATVAELKVALLLAAGRPAPAGRIDALTLWRVDMSAYDLAYLDAQGYLEDGRQPAPIPRGSTPPIALLDNNACVGDYISSRCSRADPNRIDISAHIHESAITALAPRAIAPPFTYPMPAYLLEAPREPRRSTIPLPATYGYDISAWATASADVDADGLVGLGADQFIYPDVVLENRREPNRLCSSGYEGLGGPGLVGLGITMSPAPSSHSDHTCSSRDEECASWPPTPKLSASEQAETALEAQAVTALALGWTPALDNTASTPKHLQALFVPPPSSTFA